MKNFNIAIVGASGLVGEKIIQVLFEEKIIDSANLTLFVSSKSAGKIFFYRGIEFRLVLLNEKNINQKFDIVFFSSGDDISRMWVKKFAENGAYVIDNSNAFRRVEGVPLVVPEINMGIVSSHTKIISNPNCSTIQLAIAINELLRLAEIEKVVVSSYQSVSGAGKKALQDLIDGTKFEIKEGIKDNVVVRIGEIEENGFCSEENKIMFEMNKILNKNISVCANTVRVPIKFCHTESVYVKFNKNVNISNIFDSFNKQYIKMDSELSLPSEISDTNTVHICRLRQFSDNEISFFVVADNLRRGAAYNAVLIAKYIINNILTK